MGDKDRGSAALAGAAGAVAAEVVAEAITDNAIKNIHAEAKAEGKVLTEAEFQERFSTTLEMTTDWGRLGAAVTALVTDLDANIATATAANAVNNNLIPMLVAVGYVAYVAYDVYDTYKEEGLKAAVLKLGFEVGTGIVGGVVLKNAYKLGKIVAPTAEAAWIAYMEAHPGVAMVMDKLMGKLTPTITKVTEKVAAGVNKVADKMAKGVKEVNDAARNLLNKGQQKQAKKWLREPASIQDQMALDAAKRGEGKKLIDSLNDPLYKNMEKWEYKVKSSNGKDTVVHYVKNPETGELLDFKFKKRSID
jgi:hypothetical protein